MMNTDPVAHAGPLDVIRAGRQREHRGGGWLLDLAGVQISTVTVAHRFGHRTAPLIPQPVPEVLQLLVIHRGGIALVRDGGSAVLGPGDLLLRGTGPACPDLTVPGGEGVEATVVQFHRPLLALRPDEVVRITGVPMSARAGVGAVFIRYLEELTGDGSRYRPADAARLATVTVDLLAAVCTHHLETEPPAAVEDHQRLLQIRIHDFIQRRLGDPLLGPTLIAAVHQISPRYLHKLFQRQGLTVAGWIRQRRLDRCRRELADPQLRTRSVRAIGARWGFTDAGHFNKVFRSAYGMPPGDYRNCVLGRVVRAEPMTGRAQPSIG